MLHTPRTYQKHDLLEHYKTTLQSERVKSITGSLVRELWSGAQGKVYEIGRENSVLKLFYDTPENLAMARQEACKQEDFWECLWHAYKSDLLTNLRIPAVFEKLFDDQGRMIWVILERVYGMSLYEEKTRKELINKGIETEAGLKGMTESEIIKKYDVEVKWLDYFPEDFSPWLCDPIITETLEEVVDFFGKLWLSHWDIHSGNIMIGKDGNLYLIDFWKSTRNGKRIDAFKQARDSWREYRQLVSLGKEVFPRWEEEKKNWIDLPTVSELFRLTSEELVEGEEIMIQHNWLPRWVLMNAAITHYNILKGLHPQKDGYYYPNVVWYNIDGWYFLLTEENRRDTHINPYSGYVLGVVMKSRVIWKLFDQKTNKISTLYSINRSVTDLIKEHTRTRVFSILEG